MVPNVEVSGGLKAAKQALGVRLTGRLGEAGSKRKAVEEGAGAQGESQPAGSQRRLRGLPERLRVTGREPARVERAERELRRSHVHGRAPPEPQRGRSKLSPHVR
jgi:hypothetical protein